VNEKETKTNGIFHQCPMCNEAWDLKKNKIEVKQRVVAKAKAKSK
jgi:hypothetical protein